MKSEDCLHCWILEKDLWAIDVQHDSLYGDILDLAERATSEVIGIDRPRILKVDVREASSSQEI